MLVLLNCLFVVYVMFYPQTLHLQFILYTLTYCMVIMFKRYKNNEGGLFYE